MSATIKICGLKDYDAIQTAVDTGAKYLGFVCDYPKSPRSLSPYKLAEITKNISNLDAYKVAVVVDPDDTLIHIIKDSVDFLQLHGSETNERVLDIKKKFDFILSNPPYLTSSEYRNLSKDVKDYEPKQALVGGFDGILYYKKIISFSKSSLKKNGFLALEIGDGQYKEIKKLLTNHSFRILDKYQLIDGEIRCILASKI